MRRIKISNEKSILFELTEWLCICNLLSVCIDYFKLNKLQTLNGVEFKTLCTTGCINVNDNRLCDLGGFAEGMITSNKELRRLNWMWTDGVKLYIECSELNADVDNYKVLQFLRKLLFAKAVTIEAFS